MRASKIGIEITKPELTALLAFAGLKEGRDTVYFGIRRQGGKLVASATDGHRALEVTSESNSQEEHVVGEWSVARAFLEACGHVVETSGLCVLLVTDSGLKKARIMDVESMAERATIGWHEEAASTQITMDTLSTLISQAKLLAAHQGSWFAVRASYLADMQIVSKACSKAPLTIYPPADPISPMYFEATSDGAQWRGVVMPVRVTAPGGLSDEAADEDSEPGLSAAPSNGVRETVQELRDILEEGGGTATLHYDGQSTQLHPPRKPSKPEPELSTAKGRAKLGAPKKKAAKKSK